MPFKFNPFTANFDEVDPISIGDVVAGGTEGSVLFIGSSLQLSEDNSNLFWDDSNNRLGINTATPAQALHNTGITLLGDKLAFTQTDLNEYIDSEADGDLDLAATISIDFQIGGTEQITLTDGSLTPTTDSDVDLGSATNAYKNLYTDNIKQNSLRITADTSDGSDNSLIRLGGGGAISGDVSRGATMQIHGADSVLAANKSAFQFFAGIFPTEGFQFFFGPATVKVYVLSSSTFSSQLDSASDLGTSSFFWKDLYVDNIVGPTTFNEAGSDVDFRFESLGQVNALFIQGSDGKVGIGTGTPSSNADLTLEGGVLNIKETTTPTADTDYGKIYTKNNNELFFQDGAGTEHLLHGDAFSNLWFHGASTVVTIGTQNAFTKITLFENVGDQDDLGNVVGSTANNEITTSSGAGASYDITFHVSITAVGANREMMITAGIELATPLDIINVTDNGVSPIIITSTAHGLLNGDMVEIADVLGNTAANGSFMVANKAANTFEIQILGGGATTGNGDYDEGTPTGDVTIKYPGNLVMHRLVSQNNLGVGGVDSDAALADGDKVALYVANLDAASNLNMLVANFKISREGD